jgi:HD superfamily phosphohydrolase
LYDIISNIHSGLDVDKMDYFSRDGCRTATGESAFNDFLLENAYVAKGRCECRRNVGSVMGMKQAMSIIISWFVINRQKQSTLQWVSSDSDSTITKTSMSIINRKRLRTW